LSIRKDLAIFCLILDVEGEVVFHIMGRHGSMTSTAAPGIGRRARCRSTIAAHIGGHMRQGRDATTIGGRRTGESSRGSSSTATASHKQAEGMTSAMNPDGRGPMVLPMPPY
jgi:hypothetical protein